MNIPMNDLKAQYSRYKVEIDEAIQQILDSTQFIGGNPVKKFENNLSEYLDGAHVIACANGTDALQVALMACDLNPGDEIITTPFTFAATAEVICLLKLKPVFVDIHPDTFCLNENHIEAAITPNTKCIIPVHLFGQCANMEAIMKIAEAHNLIVVEDAAQSLGSKVLMNDGSSVHSGTIGHIGTTSFSPSKNLGAYGDGGAIYTRDESLAIKLRMICNHGARKKYYHDIIGVNSRLDSLQAAILEVKLKYLNQDINKRMEVAAIYDELLESKKHITRPARAAYSTHSFHQYTIKLDKGRDEMVSHLKDNNISTSIYYPLSLHVQPAFSGHNSLNKSFPVTEQLCQQVLSLPIYPDLTRAQIEKITNIL